MILISRGKHPKEVHTYKFIFLCGILFGVSINKPPVSENSHVLLGTGIAFDHLNKSEVYAKLVLYSNVVSLFS